MQNRIPLPDPNNYKMFDDVFDYLQKVRERQSAQKIAGDKLAEDKRQFGISNSLEQQKLAETGNYHQGYLNLLKDKVNALNGSGGKKLSAQERAQAMKLLEQGRTGLSLYTKNQKLGKLLEKHPDLTGKMPWLLNQMGMGGDLLGEFNTTAGDIQAAISRLASSRPGIGSIKWAGKIKPNDWKDVNSNLGHVRGLNEDTIADLAGIKDEYEAITGEKYPLEIPDLQTNQDKSVASTSAPASNVTNQVTATYELVNGKLKKL